ncbi:hypothetical protein [Streptomyces gobiensis]|uniref:hypothetical protein n=1 Tax=Streptomyces gobiensis TaxID=2875706 RepID=UPI001E40D740|nr:hypothetical protein [Streptomyces gobiensis]UGY92503.1 hypothetical protein test1122_12765 [Streptomyces gobiensis]
MRTDLPPRTPTTVLLGEREFTLRRSPSATRTPEARAGGWQDWKLFEGDDVVAELWDIAAPYPGAAATRTLHGDLRGEELTVTARQSLRARRRFIEFTAAGRTLRIEARPFGRQVWVRDRVDDDREVIMLALLHASGAERYVLASPLWPVRTQRSAPDR